MHIIEFIDVVRCCLFRGDLSYLDLVVGSSFPWVDGGMRCRKFSINLISFRVICTKKCVVTFHNFTLIQLEMSQTTVVAKEKDSKKKEKHRSIHVGFPNCSSHLRLLDWGETY